MPVVPAVSLSSRIPARHNRSSPLIHDAVVQKSRTVARDTRAVEGAERARLTTVIRFNLVLFVLLLGAWLPFFLDLLDT